MKSKSASWGLRFGIPICSFKLWKIFIRIEPIKLEKKSIICSELKVNRFIESEEIITSRINLEIKDFAHRISAQFTLRTRIWSGHRARLAKSGTNGEDGSQITPKTWQTFLWCYEWLFQLNSRIFSESCLKLIYFNSDSMKKSLHENIFSYR